MLHIPPKFEIEEVVDPIEIQAANAMRAQFDLNSDWLQANLAEVYANNRGKVICVAGQQVFAADTVQEAVARATSAHPEDKGWFTRYIPVEKMVRIYAC